MNLSDSVRGFLKEIRHLSPAQADDAFGKKIEFIEDMMTQMHRKHRITQDMKYEHNRAFKQFERDQSNLITFRRMFNKLSERVSSNRDVPNKKTVKELVATPPISKN